VKSIRANLVWRDGLNSCEVNIVLLDNAGVQRVEVHNKDNLVVKLSLRFEHKATFVLVLLVPILALRALPCAIFGHDIRLVPFFCVLLDRSRSLFSPGLVRDDIFEPVELV
jgi:hypothetical protein